MSVAFPHPLEKSPCASPSPWEFRCIPKLWDIPGKAQKRGGDTLITENLIGFLGMISGFSWEFKMDSLPPWLQPSLGIVIPTWNLLFPPGIRYSRLEFDPVDEGLEVTSHPTRLGFGKRHRRPDFLGKGEIREIFPSGILSCARSWQLAPIPIPKLENSSLIPLRFPLSLSPTSELSQFSGVTQ